MKMKLTKKIVDALTCSNVHGRELIRDAQCRGLGIEVRSSGGKTYYYVYRDANGKQRSYKLANATDISPTQARILCERARAKVAMGIDLMADESTLTLDDFFTEKYLPYITSYRRSYWTDQPLYQNHVQSALGKLPLDQIKHEHIVSVMTTASTKLADASCNRLLALLRYMFNLALRWKIAGIIENPTLGYEKKKLSNFRERYLTAEETQRLIKQVKSSANPMLKYIVPMLLLTGARKREVLDARWEDIDFQRAFWRIPSTKSGSERHVPLSPAAIDLLNEIPKCCDYIFANPSTLKPYDCVHSAWNTTRVRAGLKDVRMHDLRHSFASFLVNEGCSLYEVQKILGHSSGAMTQRYSHLNQDSLMRAVRCAEVYLAQ